MWQRVKNIYHLVQAILANTFYGFPSGKLKVIGVTGTDGKTTTACLIYHILKSTGKKAALISTVGAFIGDKIYDVGFHVTNPATFPLQRFIREVADRGNEFLVLEVTSHGLDQNRVWGIKFDIGVLTNIAHEHLDYHANWEEYAEVKFNLLNNSRVCILNYDDKSYSFWKSKIKNQKSKIQIKSQKEKQFQIVTYSLNNQEANITWKKYPFKTNLIGDFNKSNCLAAIAATDAVGVSDSQIRTALKTFKPPAGRLETVYDKEFRVIIDFAHTPNAFKSMLPEIKKVTKCRLIHVFGSAGARDAVKRPQMGAESARYADIIILTAEDPRDEQVEDINSQIRQGISDKFKFHSSKDQSIPNVKAQNEVFEIARRDKAINFAINIAQKRDTVLLTGKAHEKSMNYGHGEEPWDEFEEVKSALSNYPLKSVQIPARK
ncbi:hypothetical protein A2154_01895 [Candidatus Gottesmanbacteria bacterium RBG_16_43_7]|uniref:UDP-N-acetylmuramyl-tripeptide synthetase n=1 Tax=Candidatus Gottesmanbacteria bacterium RBG_16_43_7 TaxID=1798373 RepID=A0A1F5Z7W7_9BACT|nr:MAG: hypothetical protein A2154_01895 [Candidatus Gottesmanbacteria bacterium RBG_16_43_7]